MGRLKPVKYKGFNIEIWKTVWNDFEITVAGKRFEGTRREEYFRESIGSFLNKSEGIRKAKEFLNNSSNIKWESQGLGGANYLPK